LVKPLAFAGGFFFCVQEVKEVQYVQEVQRFKGSTASTAIIVIARNEAIPSPGLRIKSIKRFKVQEFQGCSSPIIVIAGNKKFPVK
jgi:hypothetical protein